MRREVEGVDNEGPALMQVHRAGMYRAVRGAGIDGADQ